MIDSKADIHVEVARIQRQIEDYLGLKDEQLVFEYSTYDGKIKLDLITINPRHNQSFLFRSETGIDKLDAIKKLRKYIRNYKEKEDHYTIQWSIKGDNELHTSYFRASNIYDALDKLYYGRDMNTMNVYSVALNPLT